MKECLVRCGTHPRYKAIHKPRCFCEPCWRIWIDKQDNDPRKVLRRQLDEAGERRDWVTCNELEEEIDRLDSGLPPHRPEYSRYR